MDLNVAKDILNVQRMNTNVMMDYEFDIGWNVEMDEYECFNGLSILYRFGFDVYLIWILILRMDTNVMMDYEFDRGWNVEKDGYEYYDGLSILYRLGFDVYLIWILMLRMDMNVMIFVLIWI